MSETTLPDLDLDFDPFSRSSSNASIYEDLDPELSFERDVHGFSDSFDSVELTKLVRMEVLPIIGRPSRKLRAFVESSWQRDGAGERYLAEKFDALEASELAGQDDHRLVIEAAMRTIPIALSASAERVGSADSPLVALAYTNDIREGLRLAARGCVAARVVGAGRLERRLCSQFLRELVSRSGSELRASALQLVSLLAFSDHLAGSDAQLARRTVASAHLLAKAASSLVSGYCQRQAAHAAADRDPFFRPLLAVWGSGYSRLVPVSLYPLSQLDDSVEVAGQAISLARLKEAAS